MKPYQAIFELGRLSEIKNDAREINEMLGFLCIIAASPEPLDMQDWFPYLWKQGKAPSFNSETLAVDFASAVLHFYENCLLNYQQSKPLILPIELWLNAQQEITEQGIAFACGFLAGFQHSEANWQNLNLLPGSESGQLLQTTILLLSKMAMPNSDEPQMQALFAQLPDMQEIVTALPQLLSALGKVSFPDDGYE